MRYGMKQIIRMILVSLFISTILYADEVHDLLLEASRYEMELKYEKSLKLYKKALKINPNHAPTYYYIGKNYRSLKNYNESIEFLKKSYTLNPEDYDCYYELGRTYLEMWNSQQALESFNLYVEKSTIKNEHIKLETYFYLGCAYQDLGGYEEAIAQYKTAVEKMIYNQGPSYFNMALCYIKLKQYDQAIEVLKNLTKYNDRRSWALTAKCYLEQDKLQEAEQVLKEGLTNKPKRLELRYDLGVIYLLQGKKQEAIQEYQEIKKLYKPLASHLNDLINGKMPLDKTQFGWAPPQKPRKGPPKYKIILTHPAPEDEDIEYIPMVNLIN